MDKKILLVDDEQDIREVLGLFLQEFGFQVTNAANGREALEIFRCNPVPIVISDIKMPEMDGIELLCRIKEEAPETEVIMITGHGELDLAIRSLKHEATDFITKPINDDALEIALKRATERIEVRRQLKEHTENLEMLVKKQSARLVQTERLAAIGQAVEGLSTALWDIAAAFEGGIKYFNDMPCFVATHSRDLKIKAVNALYQERLGDMTGKDSWEIYQDHDQMRAICPVALTIKEGKGRRSNEIVRCRDGELLPVLVHTAPIRNQDGQVELVLEVASDISEVQRLRRQLAYTQKRYQQLFDEVPCYISLKDTQLRLVDANRRFREDFAFKKGRLCYEVFRHRSTPCEECPDLKSLSDGLPHNAEMVVKARSGKEYHVLVWSAPIRDDNGRITHVMEMATNITQIRQLENRLSNLGLLIGSVSHGVKGLLTGLDGGMYLVSNGLAMQDVRKVEEGWEVVKMMVSRIREMVLDILFYAKERQLQKEPVDLRSFFNEIASAMVQRCRLHHIRFKKRCAREVTIAHMDPAAVRSALISILENAIDSCAADATTKEHRMEFSVHETAAHLVFEIKDNGIGMDRETREKIFTIFFSSKGRKGTGFGLFLANKVLLQHGGTIAVDTAPGKGSTFTVMLPKSQPQQGGAPDEAHTVELPADYSN